MPEYTLATLVAVVAVVALELFWARTGIFRSAQYWVAMAIVFGFQMLVDGWLTKLSAPIVLYEPSQHAGVRFPWDIPVEDFGFGFAMVTLTLISWIRLGRREGRAPEGLAASVGSPRERREGGTQPETVRSETPPVAGRPGTPMERRHS